MTSPKPARSSGLPDHCSAQQTRHKFQCYDRAAFIVGIPGFEEGWRGSCAQHLAKVVTERIAAISATGTIVVSQVVRAKPKGTTGSTPTPPPQTTEGTQ